MNPDTKPKQKSEKYKDLKQFLKLYIIPLVAIIMFIASILFLIIPKVQHMVDRLGDANTLNDQLDEVKTEYAQVQALNSNLAVLNSNLEVVNSIAPTGTTEVVAFRDRITLLAQQNNLDIESQILNEVPATVDPKISAQQILFLREVPVSFELSGNYNDVLNFIKQLDQIQDFIIVQEFQMEKSQSDIDAATAIWNLKLQIVKYQFEVEEDTASKFINIPPTAKISDILQSYIDSRN